MLSTVLWLNQLPKRIIVVGIMIYIVIMQMYMQLSPTIIINIHIITNMLISLIR